MPQQTEQTDSLAATCSRRTTPRRVSFQNTITIVKFHDSCCSEDKWLSLADRKVFMTEARDQSQDWPTKGYAFLVQNIFHENSETVAQEKLNAFTQLPGDDYCRGLERYACREHGIKRESFKKGAIRLVVAEGKKRQQAQLEGHMSCEQSWDEVGAIAAKVSNWATRFARRLGAADAMVALEGEDGSKVETLLAEETLTNAPKPTATEETTSQSNADNNNSSSSSSSINSTDDNGENKQTQVRGFKQQQQQSSSPDSPRSVMSVNGWCHGPRESCVVVQQQRQEVSAAE